MLMDTIRVWIPAKQNAAPLWQALRRLTRRLLARLPSDFFPEGERGDDQLEAFTDDLFMACDTKPLDRAPYDGRTPFATAAEEPFTEWQARAHFVTHPFSVAWSLLRKQLHQNRRRDPAVAARMRTHEEVTDALEAIAAEVGDRWALRAPVAAARRSDDEVAAELVGVKHDAVAFVRGLLAGAGPLDRWRITVLLQEIRGERAGSGHAPLDGVDEGRARGWSASPASGGAAGRWHGAGVRAATREEDLDVRRIAVALFGQLHEADQLLLARVAAGWRLGEIAAHDPARFADAKVVQAKVKQILDRLRVALARRLGVSPSEGERAVEICEALFDVAAESIGFVIPVSLMERP